MRWNTLFFAGGAGFAGDDAACLDDMLAAQHDTPEAQDLVLLALATGEPSDSDNVGQRASSGTALQRFAVNNHVSGTE
jgi:hypothetical protein